jgi:carbamoyl-phosphate synthase small subunit
MKKKVWLYFENGLYIEANSFGADKEVVGEVVFNTSMTGYQEIASDPSYAGQFVVFSMPEIGIVGTNPNDMQSKSLWCSGIIVRNYTDTPSNYRATSSLDDTLKKHDCMGICDIDTRQIVQQTRDQGSMMMIASTLTNDKNKLKEKLSNSKKIANMNLIEKVSTKKSYTHDKGIWNHNKKLFNTPTKKGKKIVVVDFGVKTAILDELAQSGLDVLVIPSTFVAKDIIHDFANNRIGGVFLSNGPGDPLYLSKEIAQIKQLINSDIPIFAICLGHQLLSIAFGHDTYKLKFGQHGGNHPVFCDGKVEITAQNHNYNVPKSIEAIATITHKNLFDGTIEGVKYNNKDIFSVQHHPEASPGPNESRYVFEQFASMVKST